MKTRLYKFVYNFTTKDISGKSKLQNYQTFVIAENKDKAKDKFKNQFPHIPVEYINDHIDINMLGEIEGLDINILDRVISSIYYDSDYKLDKLIK